MAGATDGNTGATGQRWCNRWLHQEKGIRLARLARLTCLACLGPDSTRTGRAARIINLSELRQNFIISQKSVRKFKLARNQSEYLAIPEL